MSDANISTTGRPVGTDPLAPDARARVLAMAEFTARGKAFRFPKGQSGNPDGQSRFYHACRQLAREASPEMMAGLIDLAKNAEDEKGSVGLPDRRAGPRRGQADRLHSSRGCGGSPAEFDPSLYSSEQLAQIEATLRMIAAAQQAEAEKRR